MSKPPTPIWDRFWPRVDADGDCWVWLGARTAAGYGSLWVSAERPWARAHRMAWELLIGPIPEGLARHPIDARRGVPHPLADRGDGVTRREEDEGLTEAEMAWERDLDEAEADEAAAMAWREGRE